MNQGLLLRVTISGGHRNRFWFLKPVLVLRNRCCSFTRGESPVVLLVPVVLQRVVVQQVEGAHQTEGQLDHGGDAAVLGEHVLVVPPPVGPAEGPGGGHGGHVPAADPLAHLQGVTPLPCSSFTSPRGTSFLP